MKNVQYLIPVAVIRNSDNKVLFVKKTFARSQIAINKWDLPGGTIEFGESFEEALQAKIKKYLGVEIIIESIIPYVHSTVTIGQLNDQKTNMQFYLLGAVCKLKDETIPFQLKPGKISEVRFLSLAEYSQLPEDQKVPGDQEILQAARPLFS